jgi:multiple sugar transport system permease protein
MALLLNSKIRGQAIYRTVFYIPSITPVVASTIVWLWLFNGQYRLLNVILGWLGLPPVGWLTNPSWTKPSLIFMGMWFGGNTILIYLASLRDVPVALLESAELDGANAWQKLWHITLPMISPVIFYTMIINIIGYFQYFTEAWVLTATREGSAGGPLNSMLFYAMYLYQTAFQHFKMGYASAQAWVLFMIVLLATAAVFRTSGWVYYHAEDK